MKIIGVILIILCVIAATLCFSLCVAAARADKRAGQLFIDRLHEEDKHNG